MASVYEFNYCCGVSEIGGLGTSPEECLKEAVRAGKQTHYVFVDARTKTNFSRAPGTKLMAYIKRHKLGEVIASEWKPNVVHGPNSLRTYVWTVDHRAFDKWQKKNDIKPNRISDW